MSTSAKTGIGVNEVFAILAQSRDLWINFDRNYIMASIKIIINENSDEW